MVINVYNNIRNNNIIDNVNNRTNVILSLYEGYNRIENIIYQIFNFVRMVPPPAADIHLVFKPSRDSLESKGGTLS